METNIAKKVVHLIENNLNVQNQKGNIKYGISLDDVPNDKYDWNQMVIEELIDGIQYLTKENQRLKKEVDQYKKMENTNVVNEVMRMIHVELTLCKHYEVEQFIPGVMHIQMLLQRMFREND